MTVTPFHGTKSIRVPACLWFLMRDKTAHGRDGRGEIHFIDARKLGEMETRVHRIFTDADVAKIADTAYPSAPVSPFCS
jgi:type I restriction enzyme M protein